MNNKQEELIAAHLAGENVSDDLLREIRKMRLYLKI